MDTLTPKQIMTKDVITAKAHTPIYEAMELMAKHDVSGLPVVEDDMTLVAILSEKDVISLLDAPGGAEEKTVGDFMTQPALYFDEDESLLDVCDFLKKNVFRRVPITSEGKLVGLISIRDVIEYILGLREKVSASTDTSERRRR